jgi:hypothetical protein
VNRTQQVAFRRITHESPRTTVRPLLQADEPCADDIGQRYDILGQLSCRSGFHSHGQPL